MKQARSLPQVSCQGHIVQIYANISPSTIQRRRMLKPLLSAMAQKEIKYKWAFPFAVKFSHKGQNHSFSSFIMGEKLLLNLKIISQEMDTETSPPPPAPTNVPSGWLPKPSMVQE